MKLYLISDAELTEIANAIRARNGESINYTPAQMAQKARAAQSKTTIPSADQQVITPDVGYVGLSGVTVKGDANLIPANIKSGVSIFGVSGEMQGGGEVPPKLHAPTISLEGSILTILDSPLNGDFCDGFRIYSDGVQITVVSENTVDLSQYITGTGSHSVTVKSYASLFQDSDTSQAVSYSVAWEDPVADSDTVAITQVYRIEQSGNTLILE